MNCSKAELRWKPYGHSTSLISGDSIRTRKCSNTHSSLSSYRSYFLSWSWGILVNELCPSSSWDSRVKQQSWVLEAIHLSLPTEEVREAVLTDWAAVWEPITFCKLFATCGFGPCQRHKHSKGNHKKGLWLKTVTSHWAFFLVSGRKRFSLLRS